VRESEERFRRVLLAKKAGSSEDREGDFRERDRDTKICKVRRVVAGRATGFKIHTKEKEESSLGQ